MRSPFPPVRISLFLGAMAIIVGLLAKHYPQPLVGSITPAVLFLAVLALVVISAVCFLPAIRARSKN